MESAATGALEAVVGKLTALLAKEYKLLAGARGEMESLTCELDFMRAFLADKSKAEDPGELDKIWMKEVREMSYDVEDSLDDFMLRVAAKPEPDGFMDKVRSLVGRTKSRHRIAKEFEDLKKKIVEMAARNQRYRDGCSPVVNDSNAWVDRRAQAIFEDARKLVGIDGPKDQIISLLEEDEEEDEDEDGDEDEDEDGDEDEDKDEDEDEQQQPKVVSIVGPGGLGKTTLAHQVYQKLKSRFNHRVFLSVSRNPDIKRILRTVLYEVVSKEDYDTVIKGDYVNNVAEIEHLIPMIKEYLTGKRYFIVLDDIWDVGTWETIMNIFPMTNCGSKIITTTRINDVARKCCFPYTPGHIYNIRPLSMEHSTQLFHRRLFNHEEKCPSHLEEISCQILHKCAGLPLAIISISGLLSSKKQTKEEWDQVKNSMGRGLERNSDVDSMLKILSLSYIDLPLHLRTCLLYLSIFPEDYTIGKEDLIRRWIGEGFIHEQNGFAAYDLGERCFNDLINRGLIQPGGKDDFDEVKSCRVHDTVLDFIVSKAIDENFVTLIGVPGLNPTSRNKVRRLSMQSKGEIPAGLVLSSVRSLNVFGSNVQIPSLSEFRFLRILAFEDHRQLKNGHLADVGDLVHLRYVYVQNTITEIPVAIYQVERLLECLVTLVVDRYVVLPDEIADMKALQVLEGVNVYIQSVDLIEQLGELTNLRKLGMRFINSDADEDWEEKYEEIVSSICKLTKASLDSLHIHTLNEPPEVLNRLSEEQPDPCLRELVITGDTVSDLEDWWCLLVKLKKLLFFVDESVSEEDVETLARLSDLEHLCVHLYDADDDDPEVKAPLERAMKEHPKRPKLVWVDEY